MKPHPVIAALREDDTPQRQAQLHLAEVFDRWLEGQGDVLADLPRLARRGELADAPALARLFAPGEGAQFAQGLISAMVRGLTEAPLGHVPARHFTDGVTSTLLLGRSGPVTLALAAVDGAGWAQRPVPTTVSYTPTRHWDVVLAGHGQGDLVSPDGRHALSLAPGVPYYRDGMSQAFHLRRVEGCLVWLRLQWRDPSGAPTRVHDLAGGALVRQAAGTMRESRQMVMLSLLGRMGHVQAAPIMAAMAREEGPADLRWNALREAMGLDTALGFAALAAMADDAGDPLQGPARAWRDRLLIDHPQLERLMPCPM
jgi:hypothetical protein